MEMTNYRRINQMLRGTEKAIRGLRNRKGLERLRNQQPTVNKECRKKLKEPRLYP